MYRVCAVGLGRSVYCLISISYKTMEHRTLFRHINFFQRASGVLQVVEEHVPFLTVTYMQHRNPKPFHTNYRQNIFLQGVHHGCKDIVPWFAYGYGKITHGEYFTLEESRRKIPRDFNGKFHGFFVRVLSACVPCEREVMDEVQWKKSLLCERAWEVSGHFDREIRKLCV